MSGQERREVRLDADRPHARAAAAVRNAEGLVKIHVAHVGADVARTRETYERVEIGAVEIDLATVRMRDTMAASWNRRRCSGELPNPKAAGIR